MINLDHLQIFLTFVLPIHFQFSKDVSSLLHIIFLYKHISVRLHFYLCILSICITKVNNIYSVHLLSSHFSQLSILIMLYKYIYIHALSMFRDNIKFKRIFDNEYLNTRFRKTIKMKRQNSSICLAGSHIICSSANTCEGSNTSRSSIFSPVSVTSNKFPICIHLL